MNTSIACCSIQNGSLDLKLETKEKSNVFTIKVKKIPEFTTTCQVSLQTTERTVNLKCDNKGLVTSYILDQLPVSTGKATVKLNLTSHRDGLVLVNAVDSSSNKSLDFVQQQDEPKAVAYGLFLENVRPLPVINNSWERAPYTNPTAGINIGTANTSIGVWDNGHVEMIPSELGKELAPAVMWMSADQFLVGDSAESYLTVDPYNIVYDIRRLLGQGFSDEYIQEHKLCWPFSVQEDHHTGNMKLGFSEATAKSPDQIFTMFLQKLKSTAEEYVDKKIKHAVVTVPTSYTSTQRELVLKCCKKIGLEAVLINDTTAAAIAHYHKKKPSQSLCTLIFDFGAGNVGVSIIQIIAGRVVVQASCGDNRLGGRDIDENLLKYFADIFTKRSGIDVTKDKRAMQRLRQAIINAKHTLSQGPNAKIDIDEVVSGQGFDIILTRSKFDELNTGVFDGVKAVVEKFLRKSQVAKEEIGEILMIGGSSRIPKVQSIMRAIFQGRTLKISNLADKIVAHGAAIAASSLTSVGGLQWKDVLSVPVSVTTEDEECQVIAKQNTQLPIHKVCNFTTTSMNQTEGMFKVTQNQDRYVFKIDNLNPRNTHVDIKFVIDKNSILKFSRNQSGMDQSLLPITGTDTETKVDKEPEAIQSRKELQSYMSFVKNKINICFVEDKKGEQIRATCKLLDEELQQDQLQEADYYEEKLKNLKKMWASFEEGDNIVKQQIEVKTEVAVGGFKDFKLKMKELSSSIENTTIPGMAYSEKREILEECDRVFQMVETGQIPSSDVYVEPIQLKWNAILANTKRVVQDDHQARKTLKEYASGLQERLSGQRFIEEPEKHRLRLLTYAKKVIADINYSEILRTEECSAVKLRLEQADRHLNKIVEEFYLEKQRLFNEYTTGMESAIKDGIAYQRLVDHLLYCEDLIGWIRKQKDPQDKYFTHNLEDLVRVQMKLKSERDRPIQPTQQGWMAERNTNQTLAPVHLGRDNGANRSPTRRYEGGTSYQSYSVQYPNVTSYRDYSTPDSSSGTDKTQANRPNTVAGYRQYHK